MNQNSFRNQTHIIPSLNKMPDNFKGLQKFNVEEADNNERDKFIGKQTFIGPLYFCFVVKRNF